MPLTPADPELDEELEELLELLELLELELPSTTIPDELLDELELLDDELLDELELLLDDELLLEDELELLDEPSGPGVAEPPQADKAIDALRNRAALKLLNGGKGILLDDMSRVFLWMLMWSIRDH